jgi:formyltetrahydrofolate-dependent phosphoribosylglycinamide formyltransferase
MFERLQKKWKVNGVRVLLILCTFAIGGSLTGYAGKKLINLLSISQPIPWIITYILIITILWPLAVLLISIPFGQFRFFTGYLKKMGSAIAGRKRITETPAGNPYKAPNDMATNSPQPSGVIRLAIFASGAGSNAQKIIGYFRQSDKVKVVLVASNKPGAGVLSIAREEGIPTLLIEKEKFFRGNAYVDELNDYGIDLIILAGFLWKVPPELIRNFRGRIVNIHPALLPKYGGKGMYGNHVHAAVIAAGDRQSGITIHYVDEHYDHGETIFQAYCDVPENDTADTLAQRIHRLEHEHYPRVIEKLADSIAANRQVTR